MRVLVIKMSSMGDVIHTLPALTDAGQAIPSISFDWVVEENFQEIPAWHPLVKNIIPIRLRHWRKNLFSSQTRNEWKTFKKLLTENKYDLIIDAQGLVKSAFISRLAKGKRVGLNFTSARESFAALFYQQTYAVNFFQHAIVRARQLFSQALGYALPHAIPNYGIDRLLFQNSKEEYLVFVHGTTWTTKHWPEEYWIALAKLAAEKNIKIKLSWGNAKEYARAERIAAASNNVEILPKYNLKQMAHVLASAKAVVAVDTGLGHLAAALDVPTISLYGPTNPVLTGTMGRSQKHVRTNFSCSPCLARECSQKNSYPTSPVSPPCFSDIAPTLVWREIEATW